MDTQILEQYGISYKKIRIDGDIEFSCNQETISDLSYSICGYLGSMGPYKDFYEDELLIEINKAIQGLTFESDGGGDNVYLTIGYPNSIFEFEGVSNNIVSTIPTEDLKQILLLWIDFVQD